MDEKRWIIFIGQDPLVTRTEVKNVLQNMTLGGIWCQKMLLQILAFLTTKYTTFANLGHGRPQNDFWEHLQQKQICAKFWHF